jgi:hypothetical protein
MGCTCEGADWADATPGACKKNVLAVTRLTTDRNARMADPSSFKT